MIYQTGIFFLILRSGRMACNCKGGQCSPPLFFATSILLELEEWLIYQTGGYLGRRIYFRGQIDNQESWEGGGTVLPTPLSLGDAPYPADAPTLIATQPLENVTKYYDLLK